MMDLLAYVMGIIISDPRVSFKTIDSKHTLNMFFFFILSAYLHTNGAVRHFIFVYLCFFGELVRELDSSLNLLYNILFFLWMLQWTKID